MCGAGCRSTEPVVLWDNLVQDISWKTSGNGSKLVYICSINSGSSVISLGHLTLIGGGDSSELILRRWEKEDYETFESRVSPKGRMNSSGEGYRSLLRITSFLANHRDHEGNGVRDFGISPAYTYWWLTTVTTRRVPHTILWRPEKESKFLLLSEGPGGCCMTEGNSSSCCYLCERHNLQP